MASKKEYAIKFSDNLEDVDKKAYLLILSYFKFVFFVFEFLCFQNFSTFCYLFFKNTIVLYII